MRSHEKGNGGGKNHYYLTDALGSVVALADESGTKVNTYAYSPRGVQRATTTEQVPQPYRFAGGYQDPTGLYHFAARYYDPNIGRFTTPPPTPPARKRTPTSTPKATPSTVSTPPDSSA